MYLAVTGCRGFLGHHLVRYLLNAGHYVLGIDAETYAGLHPMPEHERAKYIKADICTLDHLPDVDAVIHCAAETHVDNSLANCQPFLRTNVMGVGHLLELVRSKGTFRMPLFLHISTDEVLGSIAQGAAGVDAPLRPANPYAASKAAAEVLVEAWGRTHGVPYQIVRMSNLYGIGQYPEKLIPKTVRSIKLGRPMPIHGDGSAVRHWLNVIDACDGIEWVRMRGPRNRVYHLGGNVEASVATVTRAICDWIGVDWSAAVELGYTRQSLDARYCLDDGETRTLGWQPVGNFPIDLPHIVNCERASFRW